jgi:hypothetical protein
MLVFAFPSFKEEVLDGAEPIMTEMSRGLHA